MRKSTKRLLGRLALATGALSAAGAILLKKTASKTRGRAVKKAVSVWARPGMAVTFRAEVMPGREANDRTFRVKELLPNGRVLLHGVAGDHAEQEFEPVD